MTTNIIYLLGGCCLLFIGIMQFKMDVKSEEGKNLFIKILRTIFSGGTTVLGAGISLIIVGIVIILINFFKIIM